MDAELGGAAGLLAGANAFGDVAGDCIVARRKGSRGDGGGLIGPGELAAAGAPGVGGLPFKVEVGGCRCDCDGIAGKDVSWLSSAAELNRRRGGDLAEAENAAGGEPVGEGLAEAADEWVSSDGAEVYVGVVKVGLDGTDCEAVVEERKDVIDADATGDPPPPFTGLERWSTEPGRPDHGVGEGNETILLITKDGTGPSCVDGVIGAVARKVAFDLDSQKSVEEYIRTGDEAWIDGLIEVVIDVAVDRMDIGIASIEIDAGELRRGCAGSLNSLGYG